VLCITWQLLHTMRNLDERGCGGADHGSFAADTPDASETFIKNEPDTPSDRSESLALYGSASIVETPAWAATSDSADRLPMSYCFEPSFESAIETLLDPPADYHDALFTDFHIAADAHESLWVLA
jgi:hypothetical protein